MSNIVVVYHSGYGHTQRMAQSVAQGAGAELVAIDAEGNVDEAGWAALNAADAIIMGSPTYMGTVSWQFKKWADASSKAWFTQAWKDKVFAGFTNSATMNGDKHSTLHYLITLAMQHGMLWAGNPVLPEQHTGIPYDEAANRLGSWTGLMAQAGHHAPAVSLVSATPFHTGSQ